MICRGWRGGQPFVFHGSHNIDQYAFYVSDTIKLRGFTFSLGLRDDQYNGLTSGNGVQPRIGISYLVKPTKTKVLRGRKLTRERSKRRSMRI